MNIDKYEKQREQDIERGSYTLESATPIQINLEDEEIKKIVLYNDLDNIDVSNQSVLDFLISDIKGAIYLNEIRNDTKSITNWLFEKDRDLKEQFPKLFFMEEVASRTRKYNDYESAINCAGLLKDIKKFLDDNFIYQGYTGEQYQESDLSDKIEKLTGMYFSWRSWAALMSAYMNTKEKQRTYTYMNYYMG